MSEAIIGRILWQLVEDAEFRRRALANLGGALAEEGYILADGEMQVLRGQWDSLASLSERAAYERIMALARSYRR